jgi:hypothetical protein
MNSIELIKEKLEIRAEQYISKMEPDFLENYGYPMTSYDKEYYKLMFLYNAVRAIELYILPEDLLIDLFIKSSPKGFTISCYVERNNVKHFVLTDCIIAGGWNIQKEHYRYLTNTTLPKVNFCIESNKIKQQINIFNKREKLIKEIEDLKNRILKDSKIIEEKKSLTEQDILNKDNNYQKFYFITWEEIVRRGANINFNNSEEIYNISKEDLKINALRRFKENIENSEITIKYFNKKLERLIQKLNLIK